MKYVAIFLVFAALIVLDAVIIGCVLAREYVFTGVREREITVKKYELDKHGNRCVSLWRLRRVFLAFCNDQVDTISFPDAAAYETVKREGPTKFIAVYKAKQFLFFVWDEYVSLREKR